MKIVRKNESVIKMYECYEIVLMDGYRYGNRQPIEWTQETCRSLSEAKRRLKYLERLQDAGYFEWRDARICKVTETRQTLARAESRGTK